MNKAVFLDRDGVINRKAPEGRYILCWEDIRFLAGAPEAISLLNQAGLRVIVITNQRCVANGLITELGLKALHARMCDAMVNAGAFIDAIYYCPHELQPPCSCRKPLPGMLLEAARIHQIDLAGSWMIGDSDVDVEAGRLAGCKTVRLLDNGEPKVSNADMVAGSLLEAVRRILKN